MIKVNQFKLPDLVRLFKERIPQPIKLAKAPSFFNRHENLYQLYDYLEEQPNPESASNLNIFLSDDETLRPLGALYWAEEDGRDLLMKANLLLIEGEIQAKYDRLFQRKLHATVFEAQELIRLLRDWADDQDFPLPVKQCHQLINNKSKISRVMTYLQKHLDSVSRAKRDKLPLCLGIDGNMYRCGDDEIFYADWKVREFIDLNETDYTLLDSNLQSEYGKELIALGCPQFEPGVFINYLSSIAKVGKLTHKPDELRKLYGEVDRQLRQLTGSDQRNREVLIEQIKALPIYLTKQERL